MKYKFPKDFMWGAVTAAHQVEGGLHNAWTEWEQRASEERASRSKEDYLKQIDFIGEFREELWEEVNDDATDPNNYISGMAADHYNRYESDLDLAKELNINTYRFSIEWARIQPEEGDFIQEEIDHYRKVLEALKQRDIKPFVTLWHFTLPAWFQDKGGFEKKENLHYFYEYVEKVMEELGDYVDYWVVMNEPLVWVAASYISGDWPPNKRIGLKALRIMNNLIAIQKESYSIIKSKYPNSNVGFSKHVVAVESHWYSIAKPLAMILDWLFNYRFINRLKGHFDYLGFNFYVRANVTLRTGLRGLRVFFTGIHEDIASATSRTKNPDIIGLSDMGWELYPKGMYKYLKSYGKKYHKPIIITEHGLADRADENRKHYIAKSLMYVHKAMNEGVDIRGYLHWTLIDNFEWDKGFWPRFGLIEVDFDTQKRTVRDSARWFAEVIKNNGFEYKNIFKK